MYLKYQLETKSHGYYYFVAIVSGEIMSENVHICFWGLGKEVLQVTNCVIILVLFYV